jgi:hypothetical protein
MKALLIILCVLFSQTSYAQYTFKKLTQKSITRTKTPIIAPIPKEWGDTLIVTYSGGSVEIVKYFVDAEFYDNIFYVHPTGLYLNGQHFNFYCDPDNTVKQSVSDIADIYEFTFLDRNYLCTFTLREQNLESKYKCYNLFDITDVNKITQVSFPSIHVGDDSFGDFNNDNMIDFLTVIKRKPESFKEEITGTAYMVRAYTFNNGKAQPLINDSTKLPNYIYALCDENMDNFKVFQCDWQLPLQDSTGKILEKVPYYDYTIRSYGCDGYTPIYTLEKQKVERNKYSVVVGSFNEYKKFNRLAKKLKNKKVDAECGGIFMILDQYNNDISFVLMVGNYVTKKEAEETVEKLKKLGYSSKIKDLRSFY